jgi:hypothetical protein
MLSRTVGLAIAIGALGLAPAAASAAPQDFTSGSASYECVQTCGADLMWTGHGTPADAWGQARIDQPGVFIKSKATVDCVDVDGNRATISGRVEEPSGATDGEFYAIQVEDNGPPAKNDPEPDRIHVGYHFIPIDCTLANEFPPIFPVSRGNVVVMDRTP